MKEYSSKGAFDALIDTVAAKLGEEGDVGFQGADDPANMLPELNEEVAAIIEAEKRGELSSDEALFEDSEQTAAGEAQDEAVSSGVNENATNEQNEEFIKSEIDDKPPESENKEDKNNEKRKLGKFKNPQELLKAYGELEKEFTRRSQRLRELENETRPYVGEAEWKRAVDKFFERIPSARSFARDIASEILAHPELKQRRDCLDAAFINVMGRKYRSPEQLVNDGEFLEKYVYASKAIRDKIIGDYVADVRSGKPPRSIADAGLQPVAPAKKPRTLEEAGFMFLKDNK